VTAWVKRFGLHLAAAVGATGVLVTAAAVGANQTVSQPRTPTARVVRNLRPERSLAGSIKAVEPDAVDVVGIGGREWRVEPAPGALIRLNGKAARLDAVQPGEHVVILGQAESGPGLRFVAHAITVRSK
jgi:hypothetical protein